MASTLTKPNVSIIIFVVLTDFFSTAGSSREQLVVDSDTLTNGTFELASSTVRILCNFKAVFVHVYFEISSSLDLKGFILKGLNKCGTTFLTLGYNNADESIPVAPDDGIMMHMLMILNNAEEPINLSHLRKKSAEKHRSFFVVLIEPSQVITTGWLRNTFQSFWDRWILNVIIVCWDNGLQIYTHSPFSKFLLEKLPSNTYKKDQLFPIQIVNMQKHKLRISLYAEEVRAVFLRNNLLKGSDGFMADLIATRMNATKVVVIPEDNYSGEIYDNNSADGSIGYIVRDEVDLALNTRYLLPRKFRRKVESTHVYGRDDLCVMVPASALETPLFNIFRSFDRDVWTAVLIVPFVVYFVLKLLSPLGRWNFLTIFASMFGNSSGAIPSTSRVRLVMAIWLLHCFIILNCYSGNLTSNLVLPKMTSPINTIQQLVDSPLEILIYKRFAPHIYTYLNSSKAAQLELKLRVRAVTDKYYQNRMAVNDLTKAYIDKNHIVSFRVGSRSHTRRGQQLFHKMKECPVPFYTVYVVPYGSPYLGFLNKILRQTQEHGIIQFWDRVMEINSKLSGKFVILNKGREDDTAIAVEMVHLLVAFYILMFGLCISCFVFLGEMLMYQRTSQQAEKNEGFDLSVLERTQKATKIEGGNQLHESNQN